MGRRNSKWEIFDAWAKLRTHLAGVAKLLLGSIGAQLIPLTALPLLTRLYDPNAFASFMIVYGIAVTSYVLITLRLDSAYLIEPEETISGYLFNLLLKTIIALSALLAVFMGMCQVAGIASISIWWAAIAGFGLFQASILWCLRQGMYLRMSAIRLSNAAGFVLAAVLLGALGEDWGLVGALILANGTIGVAALLFGGSLRHRQDGSTERLSIPAILARHRAFPLKDMPAGLISSLSIYLPNLAIASGMGETASGYYAFAQRLLQGPAATVSMAFGEVFKREAAKSLHRTGGFSPVAKAFLAIMAPLGLALFLVVQVLDGATVGHIFGGGWSEASQTVRILAIRYSIAFFAAPIGFCLILAGMQGLNLVWQVGNLLATIGSLYVGIITNSLEAFAWCYALSGLGLYALYLAASLKVAARGHLAFRNHGREHHGEEI